MALQKKIFIYFLYSGKQMSAVHFSITIRIFLCPIFSPFSDTVQLTTFYLFLYSLHLHFHLLFFGHCSGNYIFFSLFIYVFTYFFRTLLPRGIGERGSGGSQDPPSYWSGYAISLTLPGNGYFFG